MYALVRYILLLIVAMTCTLVDEEMGPLWDRARCSKPRSPFRQCMAIYKWRIDHFGFIRNLWIAIFFFDSFCNRWMLDGLVSGR